MFSVTPATGEIKEEKPSPQATDTPAGSEYIAETGYHVGAAAEMTADQQIRAKALECAVKWHEETAVEFAGLKDTAAEFERYIREGK